MQGVGTATEDGNLLFTEEEAVADSAVADALALELHESGQVERDVLRAGGEDEGRCTELFCRCFQAEREAVCVFHAEHLVLPDAYA